jgi:hypothetical protein
MELPNKWPLLPRVQPPLRKKCLPKLKPNPPLLRNQRANLEITLLKGSQLTSKLFPNGFNLDVVIRSTTAPRKELLSLLNLCLQSYLTSVDTVTS